MLLENLAESPCTIFAFLTPFACRFCLALAHREPLSSTAMMLDTKADSATVWLPFPQYSSSRFKSFLNPLLLLLLLLVAILAGRMSLSTEQSHSSDLRFTQPLGLLKPSSTCLYTRPRPSDEYAYAYAYFEWHKNSYYMRDNFGYILYAERNDSNNYHQIARTFLSHSIYRVRL